MVTHYMRQAIKFNGAPLPEERAEFGQGPLPLKDARAQVNDWNRQAAHQRRMPDVQHTFIYWLEE